MRAVHAGPAHPAHPAGGGRGGRRHGWRTGPVLVAAALAGSLLAAPGAQAGTTPAGRPAQAAGTAVRLGWHAQARPFRLSYLGNGRELVGQTASDVAGPGGRLAYALADGSTHHATDLLRQRPVRGGTAYTVGTDEPGRTAEVAVRRTPRGLRVEWSLQPSTGVTGVFEALTGSDAEHFLGGGANALFVDLRHRIVLDKVLFAGAEVFDQCAKSSAASPFFASTRGYAIFPDTPAIGRLAFPNAADSPPDCSPANAPPCPVLTGQPDRIQLCFKADRLDYEIYAGSFSDVIASYTELAGHPAIGPPAQFALMKWRDTVHGSGEVTEDVDQFARLGIPLGTVWIDNPWELENAAPPDVGPNTSCMGTLRFDPRMFPDPAGMIDYLRSHGVHLGLWISPYVAKAANGQPCPPNDFPPGSLIPAPGDPNRDLVDFTNPAARQHWQAELERVLSMGVDMVKGDRGDGERDVEGSTFAGGPGTLVANRYPVLYQQATQQVLTKLYGQAYTELFRGGFTGSPAALHGFWLGDQRTTFLALRDTIRRGQTAWLSGSPVWGSDTGGYVVPTGATGPTPSLFVRWAQFSALSPVYEVGGRGLNATPWVYDQQTIDRFRATAILHYELFPYLYGLALRSGRTGVPITRPLGYQYPTDEAAWAADQEFLVGPDLLAAPVAADRAEQDGAAGQPTPVDVYLPAGNWIDLYTGQVLAGSRHITRLSTLDDFPLYLRAGSAIGFNGRTPDVWATPWGRNDLDRHDRAGWLYAPAAGRTDATSPYGGRLRAEQRGNRITLTLTGAPAETQLLVATPASPAAVRIDGRTAPPAGSLAELRAAGTGWTVHRGPFGGVLLKLHPVRGHSTISLTLA
ncbi:MAG: alpha-D-xyloside xylohydrolase [Mycobacteriales bacterium]